MKQRLALILRAVADRLDPTSLLAEGYVEQTSDALAHPGIRYGGTVYYGNTAGVRWWSDPPSTIVG